MHDLVTQSCPNPNICVTNTLEQDKVCKKYDGALQTFQDKTTDTFLNLQNKVR